MQFTTDEDIAALSRKLMLAANNARGDSARMDALLKADAALRDYLAARSPAISAS